MFVPPTAIYIHGPGLTRSLFIEVHVQSLESEWSYICVLVVSILPLSTFFYCFSIGFWSCAVFCVLYYTRTTRNLKHNQIFFTSFQLNLFVKKALLLFKWYKHTYAFTKSLGLKWNIPELDRKGNAMSAVKTKILSSDFLNSLGQKSVKPKCYRTDFQVYSW